MTKEILFTEILYLSDFFIDESSKLQPKAKLNQSVYDKLYKNNKFNYISNHDFHICFTFNHNSLDLTMESILLALCNNTHLSKDIRNELELDYTMKYKEVYEKFKTYKVTKMYAEGIKE